MAIQLSLSRCLVQHALLYVHAVVQILDQYPLSLLELLGIFRTEMNRRRKYYTEIIQSPIKFWYMTRESVKIFEDIVQRMRLPILNFQRRNTNRICNITIRNRLLLVLIWLKRYLQSIVLYCTFQSMLFWHDMIHIAAHMCMQG